MVLKELRKIHEGKYLSYYVADYINANNEIKSYEFVSRRKNLSIESFGTIKADGIGIIPFSLDKKKILLQKEYRLATHNWCYNFCAGLIENGESYEEAARRELKEETGLDLKKVEGILPPGFVSNGISDEQMATIIVRCDGDITGSDSFNEEIDARWYTKEEAKKLLESDEHFSVRSQIFLYCWVNEKE